MPWWRGLAREEGGRGVVGPGPGRIPDPVRQVAYWHRGGTPGDSGVVLESPTMSPLGRYAEGVAAVVALSVIATWLTMILLGGTPPDRLHDAVLLAMSYIFVKGAPVSGDTIRTAVAQAHEAHRADTSRSADALPPAPKP